MNAMMVITQGIASAFLLTACLIEAADEMLFRWEKSDMLVFSNGKLEFKASVSFLEGSTDIHDAYGFYYEKRTSTMSLTFPAGGHELMDAIIGIKELKDGGVIEKDKKFRISRDGSKITIAITPPYGDPNEHEEPELITVTLATAIRYSNQVSNRVQFIRKAFRIDAKIPAVSDSKKAQENSRSGNK